MVRPDPDPDPDPDLGLDLDLDPDPDPYPTFHKSGSATPSGTASGYRGDTEVRLGGLDPQITY